MKPRETQALSVHTLRSRGGRKEGVEGRGLLIGLTQLWPKVTFLTQRGHCLLPNRGPWKVEEEGGARLEGSWNRWPGGAEQALSREASAHPWGPKTQLLSCGLEGVTVSQGLSFLICKIGESIMTMSLRAGKMLGQEED